MDLTDDEFDHVRDFDMSDSESEADCAEHDTPSTTPPRTQTPRPSDRKIIPCPYQSCPKTFNRNARLQEHLRSHTGERPFKCTHVDCDKTFLRDNHLKRHLKSAHSNVRDYQCTWEGCDKSFATGTRLKRHLQSHEGQEKYRCRGYEGCHETFRKHETLKKHILVVHEKQKPFVCQHTSVETGKRCEQGFNSADNLKAHQCTHDDTRFSCTICAAQRAFNNTSSERDDQNISDPNTFATFSDLQAHIAEAHPPTCPYCPTSFTTNKELTRHLELQHGVVDTAKQASKQFSCTHAGCQQVFTKRGNLNVHLKTVHEKQKDFVCGQTAVPIPEELFGQPAVSSHGCGRPFTSKASLIEHVRTAHFNLPSKRARREEKRKAKRAADEDIYIDTQPRKRAERKDKNTKKSSTLTGLTGLNIENGVADDQSFPVFSYASAQSTFDAAMDDEDENDFNQLSGSMTLFGDHLYHNGQAHHLVSESGSAEEAMLEQGSYLPCEPQDRLKHVDTEPFFDFEHEQEFLHDLIDPVLQHA